MSPEPSPLPAPTSLRILTLNCWGLKHISTHRRPRLREIGVQIASANPSPTIVALQECWTQEDYLTIRALTETILPYGKFYFSGSFGGGLAILSKSPIEETGMYRYPLNGRPSAFWRGDWFVGKGVAAARIRLGGAGGEVVEVFNTHLHAPYEERKGWEGDSYVCHRTAQAWEIGKLMRAARERGSLVLGVGDFNFVPSSLGHAVVEARGGVRDAWRVVHPDSAGASAEIEGRAAPTAGECVGVHGTTCDSVLNTWRWSKPAQKALSRGRDREVGMETADPRARRLDYVFFSPGKGWEVGEVRVGMLMRHPELRVSLSDHFSVEVTLTRGQGVGMAEKEEEGVGLGVERMDEILAMIERYGLRERRQRRWRIGHFWGQTGLSVGCLVGVWWAPANWVAFLLMLFSTLGFGAGVVDGLIGFLFVGSELRALKEFEFEVRNARARVVEKQGERLKTVDDDSRDRRS